ncbi:MAG: B12-binding domain-containing radical SAM protein [Bacteroidales bacterium]|nr:B12-binding domain-containing radical SAM protein [Bacteroidales bacterium]MCF8398799.1 B12-binding domain-containing radical SAM protein [Bacteroidales bacterium]
MNILLLYPKYPDTYWSFKHALRFISKKAAVPPLGLITVSAMLPDNWNKKLVDLNIENLKSSDLAWADFVFLSAMYIQKKSVDHILESCSKEKVKIVAGGPLFTQEYKNYPQIDHFVLNEAEITLKPFLNDLKNGKAQRIYETDEFADLSCSPVPDYHLLSVKDYAFMNIQVSRGCPFDCDFCEITALLGHKVRMKKTEQVLQELQAIYEQNWNGPVSIVDDNFVGNKNIVKKKLLPAMKEWVRERHYPFTFNIQASINLADEEQIMSLMTETGFNSAFIGIETPDEESLKSCNKVQNNKRDLVQSVRKIQNSGIQVSGGFIVGFDSDAPDIFRRQIEFIQQSGIVSAMVGLLNAPKNTKLYERMKKENRLTVEATGDNTDMSMNFTPKMDQKQLLEGYQSILNNIYSARPYYDRVRQFLRNYKRQNNPGKKKIKFSQIKAFAKSILIIGFKNRGRREYWKFMIWTLLRHPRSIIEAVTYTVFGYHFRTIYGLKR